MRLLVLAFALLSTAAQADELILHTGSYHVRGPGESQPNNFNPGVGYMTEGGWVAGLYYNSFKHPSLYVAKDWKANEYVGAFLGVATGYGSVTGVELGGLAGFRFTLPVTDRTKVNLLVTPKVGDTQTVVHLTLSVRL